MTNRILIIGIILFTCFAACNEVEVPVPDEKIESKYCVNFLRSSPDSILISAEDLGTVKSLFEFNQMDHHSLQFYRLQHDDLGYYHVRCNQFVNGLKIFRQDVIFHFKATKKYYLLSGDLVTQVDLDTVPSMAKDSVVEKYLEEFEKDEFFMSFMNLDTIKKGCFDLEFGYFDLNRWMNIDEPMYIKAWKVNLKGQENPHAYVNDLTSKVIVYDNGVRW